jgi:hypothetical protein
MIILPFDKIFLLMNESIGGLFLLVNGYFASKSRGAMQLGKGGGTVAALLRKQITFSRFTSQDGIFEHNSDRPLLHAFFFTMRYDWMYSSQE